VQNVSVEQEEIKALAGIKDALRWRLEGTRVGRLQHG
jgi:hypothetical protein